MELSFLDTCFILQHTCEITHTRMQRAVGVVGGHDNAGKHECSAPEKPRSEISSRTAEKNTLRKSKPLENALKL